MQPDHPSRIALLRELAKACLHSVRPLANPSPRSEGDTQSLLHELQAHQIELELQNEALLHSRSEVETALLLYTDLYDFAPVGYFTVDRAGVILQVNLAGARLLGMVRDEVPGKRWAAFAADVDLPCFNALVDQVFSGRGHQTAEVGLVNPRALPRAVQIEAALSPDGQACRLSALDITDRKMLEQACRREAASQAKSGFMSRMSHELRTPLNAILGFTQLLKMDATGLPNDIQHQRLDAVLLAGEHLLHLIDGVLDLSKIESGAMHMEIAPTLVQRALDEALLLVGPMLHNSGLAITFENLPADPDAMVQADKTRLVQVMANLLNNAIKYNVAGGEVRVIVDATQPGTTRVAVADTGCGMSQAQLACIGEPFNRLGQEQSGILGTGIGLVITKWLVETMGGSLVVQSEQGKGSRFDVLLPSSPRRLPVQSPA